MSASGLFVRFSSFVLSKLPPLLIQALARIVTFLGWHLARSRRRIALTNLRLCFPQMTESARTEIARAHFGAYVRAALEHGFLWNASAAAIRDFVQMHDEHHWRMHREGPEPRPVIWLCPHFVGLDAAAIRISVDTAGCSMYSKQSNADLDRLMYEGRTRFNQSEIFARTDGIKPVIRAMKKGLPFYYLPDMDFGARESVFVPFFGVNAATLTAVSRLAKLTNAVVVPVIATQRPLAPGYLHGYDVRFYPALENFPSGNDVADAKRINELVESHVLQNLPQYLWTHKRFKTRPPGKPSLY
ncbi:MAG: lipid A biosynthesis acyltransferase [Betaproteobacteria bacterium]|nr:MAG: lipid A biosynthesis acyltransferase [Betaproteobacteria bacterium]